MSSSPASDSSYFISKCNRSFLKLISLDSVLKRTRSPSILPKGWCIPDNDIDYFTWNESYVVANCLFDVTSQGNETAERRKPQAWRKR